MHHPPQGFLDGVGATVTGWAWLPADPRHRLRVAVVFDGRLRVETVADRHRGDLEAAGKGDGRCGFAVPAPAAVAGREHRVDVLLPDFPGAALVGAPRTAIPVLGPVCLRAARPVDGDVERLRALLADMARLNGGDPARAVPDAAAVAGWLAAPDRRWLVAERGGRFVGQCRVGPEWPVEPGSGALALGIEVHPDVRGFGLGRALMRAAERWAAGRGTRLELAVLPGNGGALRLYRALGYADIGETAFPATGEVHRRMALPLPPTRRPDGVTLVV